MGPATMQKHTPKACLSARSEIERTRQLSNSKVPFASALCVCYDRVCVFYQQTTAVPSSMCLCLRRDFSMCVDSPAQSPAGSQNPLERCQPQMRAGGLRTRQRQPLPDDALRAPLRARATRGDRVLLRRVNQVDARLQHRPVHEAVAQRLVRSIEVSAAEQRPGPQVNARRRLQVCVLVIRHCYEDDAEAENFTARWIRNNPSHTAKDSTGICIVALKPMCAACDKLPILR